MKPRYLRIGDRRPWDVEAKEAPSEYVPRTEGEEARRKARDWLRERTDEDAIDFEDMPDLGY